MTVLVLGASGLLGSNVVTTAKAREEPVVGTYHENEPDFDVPCYACDIRDEDAVADLITEVDPRLVVNCAAMTDVDACEQNRQKARAINTCGPESIARLCANEDREFVQISTDYVFDGECKDRYTEEDEVNPIQAYGKTKLAGEHQVRAVHDAPLVLRISFLYGIHRGTGQLSGFPAWVRSELAADNNVPLFTDQRITPSCASQVADTIFDLMNNGVTGTYHVASHDCVTPHAFGERIKTTFDLPGQIVSSTMNEVDRNAPRPTRTCLDVQRLENTLDRKQPSLVDDLDAIRYSI